MQSPLILIADFQTVESRVIKTFELSDHYGFPQERNADTQGREERLSIRKTLEALFDV
jgi:hypothetical protein